MRRLFTPAICLALAALTFAVFGQATRFDFVNFDDDLYVYNNPMVTNGLTLHGVAWAFTHVHSANWHPLTWISHMLDCQLYGLNPGPHHLTNILLHTASVIALFLTLRQMTGALWRCAFVAAVFAIHPLRAESVAWVAERKDVLSGLFFVLTVSAYANFTRHPKSRSRYTLVLSLFTLGLMCKSMLVTMPAVLLLLDYWPLRRKESPRLLVMEKLPMLALSAASCVITLFAEKEAVHSGGSFSFLQRSANALTACIIYLGQMVWPVKLAALYPLPVEGARAWSVIVAALMLAAISILAWNTRKTKPWLGVGWGWFLVMLLPVLGFIQVGRQAHADRYTYLPQIGLCLALTWQAAEWRMRRAAAGSLMAGIVGVLAVCGWKQTGYWRDSETLWTRTLNCTTQNDIAHNNLGNALCHEGKVDQGMEEFRAALKIRPSYPEAHFNLGLALYSQGKIDEAISQYEETVRYLPSFTLAHLNLAHALREKGYLDDAIVEYQNALVTQPNDSVAHNDLGTALRQKGRLIEAITQFQTALRLIPNNESVHVNLANTLRQNGQAEEAIDQYQAALQLDPHDVEVQNNFAWVLATALPASSRNSVWAVQLARQANDATHGQNPVVLHTLAVALAAVGQFSEAVQATEKAIELARAAGNEEFAAQLNRDLLRYKAPPPVQP